MEREPEDLEQVPEEDAPEPPPFDPDPNLVSFLERGLRDDPKKAWRESRASR